MSLEDKLSKAVDVGKKILSSKELNEARACFLTTLTGFLMLLAVLLASYRRRSKNPVLKAVLWASYTMSGYLIAFTMGQMTYSSTNEYSEADSDNILWALYLLVAFGSVDSLSSYSLLDSEQWRRYNWQIIMKVGGLVILLVPYYGIIVEPQVAAIILFFLLVIVSKASMKNLAMESSDTPALHRSCKDTADYMRREHKEGDPAQANPSSMKGYRYLVQGEAPKTGGSNVSTDKFVTLENVWDCRWELLSSGDRLKDLCMSFSLFRLLRVKYAGYKLPEEAHRKTLRLVREGLMLSEANDYERVFRVVEDELALLFDSFYTKRPIIFGARGRRLCLRFAEFLLLGLFSSLLMFVMFNEALYDFEENSTSKRAYGVISLIALATYLLSESLQLFSLLFTPWTKVRYICKYVKGDLWQKRPFGRKCIETICKLPSPWFKPWERKLHQYSILESCTYSPCLLFSKRFVYMFVDSPRDGQKEGVPIDLRAEVRKAVFDCLKDAIDSRSDDGIAYLRKPDASNALVQWEADLDLVSELKTQSEAEAIMVWHIATTMYEQKPNSSEGWTNSRVATRLSKYLAFLVAFAPRLLPGHPYDTELLFDQTIAEARRHLTACRTLTGRINELGAIVRKGRDNNTVLFRGAKLGIQLSDAKAEPDEIWRNLAKFWAETMLYVAPSKDDRAHADRLAYGGEFVTHLWALLYHAGIKRGKCYTRSHPHESEKSDAPGSFTIRNTSESEAPPASAENEDFVVPPANTNTNEEPDIA